MHHFLRKHPLILMEAAITEPLRRMDDITLHPTLTVSPLIYDDHGRSALEKLYYGCLEVARVAGLPFIMLTPTWRASVARVEDADVPATINGDATQFMLGIRHRYGGDKDMIKIGGLIGCRNDAYRPEEGLAPEAAERFHAWQIDQLAQAGVDFLIAETLPAVPEAVGIARAMEKTGRPYVISFVIDRNGHVLDGTDLPTAVRIIDAATVRQPLGFMVNCSYPTFLQAEAQPRALFKRLIGYQANASSLDHDALDNAHKMHGEDVAAWGRAMLDLNRRHGIRVLGGCCGTGPAHLQYIAAHYAS